MYKQKRNTAENKAPDQTEFDSGPKGDRSTEFVAERRELLNVITQETRFEIIQNIVGHPDQLPTLKELDYFIPGVSKSTIRNHLDQLLESGVVARVELPEDDRSRSLPHVFYGLTKEGREILESADLLRAEKSLQETTMNTRLTEDVERYYNAPRPDWGPANPLNVDAE